MKILTAEEFAAAVMKNGTEFECDEYKNFNRGADDDFIITIYAHIGVGGDILTGYSGAMATIAADVRLPEARARLMMDGDPEEEELEKEVIMKEIYLQYLELLEDFEY